MTKISNYPLKSMGSGMMSLFLIQNYHYPLIIPFKPLTQLGIPAIRWKYHDRIAHATHVRAVLRFEPKALRFNGQEMFKSCKPPRSLKSQQVCHWDFTSMCVSHPKWSKIIEILILKKKNHHFPRVKSLPKDIQRPCCQFFWSIPKQHLSNPPRSGCTWRIKRKRLLGPPHHPWVLGSVETRACQASRAQWLITSQWIHGWYNQDIIVTICYHIIYHGATIS